MVMCCVLDDMEDQECIDRHVVEKRGLPHSHFGYTHTTWMLYIEF
jgi:hypothetical protein